MLNRQITKTCIDIHLPFVVLHCPSSGARSQRGEGAWQDVMMCPGVHRVQWGPLSHCHTPTPLHLATSANIETDRYHTFLHHRPGRSLIHCQVNLYFPPQAQPLRSQQGYNLHHLLLGSSSIAQQGLRGLSLAWSKYLIIFLHTIAPSASFITFTHGQSVLVGWCHARLRHH